MKTAISIPDALFSEAEQFAEINGLSRSELFARAVKLYLETHSDQGVTEALDKVYDDDPNPLDQPLARAQSRALGAENW
jgi:metal-responsive CopG/Arc/MetJ family transcriptional regulator